MRGVQAAEGGLWPRGMPSAATAEPVAFSCLLWGDVASEDEVCGATAHRGKPYISNCASLEERPLLLDNAGMGVAAAGQLVGRDEELERVSAVVTFVAESPHAALIRGEAGMGKTSLWRGATNAASQAGVRVLVARGVEAEMPLAFAVLADLLEEVVPAVSECLSAPQRLALDAALGALQAGFV